MKKVYLLLATFVCINFIAQAQNNQSETNKIVSEIKSDLPNRTKILEMATPLKKRLVEKYGENFSIASTKLVSHLQTILSDKKEEQDMRRYALMILYGHKASEHQNLMK